MIVAAASPRLSVRVITKDTKKSLPSRGTSNSAATPGERDQVAR